MTVLGPESWAQWGVNPWLCSLVGYIKDEQGPNENMSQQEKGVGFKVDGGQLFIGTSPYYFLTCLDNLLRLDSKYFKNILL